MKKILIIGALFFSLPIVLHSFSTINIIRKEIKTSERISFKIRGTGSKNMLVTIGVGSKPGYGACCSGVSPYATVSFSGNVGDVVYDGKAKRILFSVSNDIAGKTINLKDYY
ncbi:hypothetical protein N8289_02135 [Flavobacteriales bacterium]|jgi:hypothetical protein|nr:hypothetical protein [Flavobacteriales bacterium]